MSLAPGPNTFSPEDLRTLWRDGLRQNPALPKPGDPRRQCASFYCDYFHWDEDGLPRATKDRKEYLTATCTKLLSTTEDPVIHFAVIDEEFSRIFTCQYQNSERDPAVSEDIAVQNAVQLLTRLPAVPPRIDLSYQIWGTMSERDRLGDYCTSRPVQDHQDAAGPVPPWAEILVVSRLSTATLKLALLVVTSGDARYDLTSAIFKFVNLVSELLDTAVEILASHEYNVVGTSIVKAFLWNAWQRSLMLYYWFVLRTELKNGYRRQLNPFLLLRRSSLLMLPSIRATMFHEENKRHSYMCSWAFELVRSNHTLLGQDFRRFFGRFASLHQDHLGRCQWESDRPCEGNDPLSCGRFRDRRLVAAEQSLHDLACSGKCKKILWDETSYRSTDGPKAVSLDRLARRIKYTSASQSTLAISHVWSHGQGSRPHIGINRCLHHRYLEIARNHQCQSYWIDSVCIPEAHDLRMEAIGYINRIFACSKVVLICDRDLMAVDVTEITLDLLESILATFLVCDWNVRAWTLLEAKKGCHGLHLLCKFNKTISLQDALIQIHKYGAIDIAILSLALRHFMPWSVAVPDGASDVTTTEVAGQLLSRRHATREGDDIVIWSLLSTIHVFNDAEQMWKAKIHQRIATAYLMSNCPRLEGVYGFSWAPKTPYIRRLRSNSSGNLIGAYSSFDGADSELGQITSKGFVADWQVYYVHAKLYKKDHSPERFVNENLTEAILSGHEVENDCWQRVTELFDEYDHIALIQPTSFSLPEPYYTARDLSESQELMFAICASHDEDKWVWKGVRPWPQRVPPPPLLMDELHII
ncbi:hypothetical protein MMC14_008190 [Varicellaria rhodocarpa]|nr:hypothetical protein [Varicellaria rhodocarpa]